MRWFIVKSIYYRKESFDDENLDDRQMASIKRMVWAKSADDACMIAAKQNRAVKPLSLNESHRVIHEKNIF